MKTRQLEENLAKRPTSHCILVENDYPPYLFFLEIIYEMTSWNRILFRSRLHLIRFAVERKNYEMKCIYPLWLLFLEFWLLSPLLSAPPSPFVDQKYAILSKNENLLSVIIVGFLAFGNKNIYRMCLAEPPLGDKKKDNSVSLCFGLVFGWEFNRRT